MSRPVVSIVTPAFNAGRFIARAVESVRAQTLNAWEMLIVDDGSSDDTVAIARAHAQKDGRIRIIRMDINAGPAAARNRGFAEAQGDWIAVLDADDLMEPWRLERLVATATAQGVDVVADNLRLVPEDDLHGPGTAFLDLADGVGPVEVTLEAYFDANHLFGGARQLGYLKPLFRAAFLRDHGLRYDDRIRIGEDYQLVAEALACGARYVIDRVTGYRYAVRAGSISRVMRTADADAMVLAEQRFMQAYGPLLTGAVGRAHARRLASLADGRAYLAMVDALKAKDVARAGALALERPSALKLMRLPVQSRLARLTQRTTAAEPTPPRASKPDPERIVAVIPTLNEAAHIGHVLRQLVEGDPRMRQVRIIVADGGSTDRTCAIVRDFARAHPNVTLLDNPARLQSAALNLAAAVVADSADVLVRCDAHGGYPPSYILDVASELVRRDADSVVVAMDAVGAGCFQRAVAWIVDTPLGAGGAAHRGGRRSGYVDHGHHAAFRLSAFLRIGGYDPSFSHNEDAEYDLRLAQAGGRVFLEAGIRKHYVPRATMRSLWRQYRNYGRGRARTLLKHAQRPRPRQMAPVANFLLQIAALAATIATPLGWIAPLGYGGALAATSVIVAVQQRSVCGLGAGPALAIIHNAWAIGFLETVLTRMIKPRPAEAIARA